MAHEEPSALIRHARRRDVRDRAEGSGAGSGDAVADGAVLGHPAPRPPVCPPGRSQGRTGLPDALLHATVTIEQVVARLQQQGSVETERLNDAIRKAILVLATAVG